VSPISFFTPRGNRIARPRVLMRAMPLDRYSCEEAFRRMDDYLDRELSPPEVERVRRHLETCAACASEYRFEDAVLRDIRRKLRRVVVPHDLRSRIEQLLASGGR
jgi:anti-sigma factor (TIGR02949 family)